MAFEQRHAEKNVLTISALSKSFPGVQALDRVDLDVRSGEVHALIGENGSGKSTLVKCVAGVHGKDSGTILLDGQEVTFNNPSQAYQSGIRVIFQERSLVAQLTVIQNVFLGSELCHRMGVLNDRKSLKEFDSLCHRYGFRLPPHTPVKRLGVAEQKGVEILKALFRHSKLIIMDEPTASLSEKEIDHLLKIILRLRERGISIVYITHMLDEVFQIADRITVLRDGRKVGTVFASQSNKAQIIAMMAGELTATRYHEVRSIDRTAEPLFQVKDLWVKPRVHGISFALYSGEILGVTGLTGSGKTEMARALFGVMKKQQGGFWINGKPVQIRSPQAAIRTGLALVPEDRKSDGLVLLFEVYKNMTLPSIKRFTNRFGIVSMTRERHKTREYQKKMNIRFASPDQSTKHLSGGNQQKIVIAKWLNTEPKIFVMDEATQGIDVHAKSEVYEIVRQLAHEGMGVLFISSEVREVLGICDRILVLRDGTVAEIFHSGATHQEVVKAMLDGTDHEGVVQQPPESMIENGRSP